LILSSSFDTSGKVRSSKLFVSVYEKVLVWGEVVFAFSEESSGVVESDWGGERFGFAR